MGKSYLKYIGVFLGIILLLDFIGGRILAKRFQNLSFGTYGKINHTLKSDAQTLILGSSRALHHYNPDIISESSGLSCHNAGLGGYGLFF